MFTRCLADCGPKPSLTIYVENPPDELYYLDLLIEVENNGTASDSSFHYDNLKDVRDKLNQHMLSLLKSYENEGWIPAISDSNRIIHGGLEGYVDKFNENRIIHQLDYIGLPRTFRIIVVTESGKVTVTETIHTKAIDSTVYFDYATGSVKQPELRKAYIIQFLLTCVPTLIIEGIILLLFGFKLKENWKPFLIVNVITQLALLLTVGVALVQGGYSAAYVVQVPMEIIIMIAEALLYRRYLVGKSKGLACGYGFVANMASWIIGVIFIDDLYNVLMKFM